MVDNFIIRGTTPQIRVNFHSVEIEDINNIVLVIKQAGIPVIKVEKEDAQEVDNSIIWTLAQKDTLKLRRGKTAVAVVDWLLTDGTRGRGEEAIFRIEDPGVEEVINLCPI